ncbi:hypothetical protein SAMN02745158_02371 [Lactonifactor longoviformis DSM 17459]|uniref:Uncharacterized protein n=1 Tax=Lactonifactor longoviformis DSM 17459 TaxID=1122155 RepID=A0A1M4YGQ5_9CLOT|nr:hypothetical protein SAMN02745158_02371 [Lactonifactor longoviformis DSM 17459]
MCYNDCHCNCSKPQELCSYAQYGVQSSPPSKTDLPMLTLFQEGKQISLADTKIILEPGYLYLIDFIFLATPEADSYMQITPKINGALKLLYSYFAPTGSASRNASASGSFTIPVTEDSTSVSFSLTYPETVRNIDITGAISVTALHKITGSKCC